MSGYGVFLHNGDMPTIGYRSGDGVVDLAAAERAGVVDADGAFQAGTLNGFLALGRAAWERIGAVVAGLTPTIPLAGVQTLLPFAVGDYVDFYSSEHHATNVGELLRPGQPALLPNWKHLPIGYHGRAGTVVVSGTEVVRPSGLRHAGDHGPSRRLDIEAEVGFVVGRPSRLGTPVPVGDFREHVFGVVLVNDWSARDIQAFEYQPLGPFLGKSFATSISAWVVPLHELATVPAPAQQPPVARYLTESDRSTFDIALVVRWNGGVVSRPPFRGLYWTPAQQLAHLTANGANLRTGDLYASGTVSGPARAQTGSFLELSRAGQEPVTLADGSTRTFLEDGDTVTISATAAGRDGAEVDLGEVTGRITPAR